MSTSSLKRLTVKAKQSMSGLNPFSDGPESPDKENENPDLEEFGYSKVHTSSTCSDTHQQSPSKESPSRRVKLMGSLKRIGSFRNIRSSPLKERGTEPPEFPEDEGSPHTPNCGVKPSLALNFQESPPNQPIFDVIRRRRSLSSSLEVQHSSPVAIPTPARQEDTPLCKASQHVCLPSGTVPSSPAPLRTALEKESTPFELAADCSPARRFIRQNSTALPTPMPGTNLGFSDHDLGRKSPGPPAAMNVPSEPSGYFSMSVDQMSPPTGVEDTRTLYEKHVRGRSQEPSSDDSIYACYAEAARDMFQDSPASLRKVHQHICDPTHARCVYPHCEKQRAHDAKIRRDSHMPSRIEDRHSAESGSSVLNIEHVVFDDSSECSLPKYEHHHRTALIQSGGTNSGSNAIAHDAIDSFPRPPTRSDINEGSAHHRWGTKGSLYDGTGYGGQSNSSSTRPSISSPVREQAAVDTTEETDDPQARAHGAVANAREHSNLEEAIRAYAALEAKCTAEINDEELVDMVAEVQADVELANDMADHSLGA